MCYTAMLDKKILGMIGYCYEVYICRRPPDLGVSKAALSLLNTAIPALYLKTKCDNENFNGLVRFAVLWWTQRDSSLGDREVWMIASALYDNVKLTIKVHCTFGNSRMIHLASVTATVLPTKTDPLSFFNMASEKSVSLHWGLSSSGLESPIAQFGKVRWATWPSHIRANSVWRLSKAIRE